MRRAYHLGASAFASVGDAELPSPASVLGAPSPVRRAGDRTPTSAGLCVSGEDADRTYVARLATPTRGLDLAFPRRRTTECREAILSVEHDAIRKPKLCLPATWSAVTAPTVHGEPVAVPTRYPISNGTRCPTTSARLGSPRYPSAQRWHLPPNGGTWRVTPVTAPHKKKD